MKVRATKMGYYGHERRYEGDVFTLEPIKRVRKDKDGKMREITIRPDQQFSERWMEKVDSGTPEKKAPKKAITKDTPLAEHHTPTEGI